MLHHRRILLLVILLQQWQGSEGLWVSTKNPTQATKGLRRLGQLCSAKTPGSLATARPANNATDDSSSLSLHQQAVAMRQEADRLREELELRKAAKLAEQIENVDRWIDELLIVCEVDENTQLINTVDQVFCVLRDRRYSQEQVTKIFNRIIEKSDNRETRSKCSELMATFVDACGKLDCLEWDDNPNKRWSGKVERVLRKRLFMRDWGMDAFEDEDEFFL